MNQSTFQDILLEYRLIAEKKEEESLYPLAAFSKNHTRYAKEEVDHRLPYKRDVDRIIHSKAYSRYGDKTQVVYLVDNDHITHRSLHVQLVSNFARGIAEILRLNLDLVEAIALGHDVGHPPFGHEGESYLSALSKEYGNGPFAHPFQSCRLFREIEPINLGLAVYDGFLCHDGGMKASQLTTRFNKTWEDHFEDCREKIKNPEENIWPGTLEGCLVKLCDTISYVGKDIEDAISLGILSRDQIPPTILGNTNRDILNFLARDIIQMSYDKNYIAVSEEAFEAIKTLRRFNFQQIYVHPKLKVESKKVKQSYRILFETLLCDLEKKREESYIWKKFISNKGVNYISQTSGVQMVVDYVAGMTDKYFIRTLEALIVPKHIEI